MKPKPQSDDDGVAVYELRFCAGYRDPDLPGHSTGGLGKLRAREGMTITYYPPNARDKARAGMYEVVHRTRIKDMPDLVYRIPRDWALYIPLECARAVP